MFPPMSESDAVDESLTTNTSNVVEGPPLNVHDVSVAPWSSIAIDEPKPAVVLFVNVHDVQETEASE